MWRVAPPRFSADEVYEACISRVADNSLRQRFSDVKHDVMESVREFEAAAIATELHRLLPSDNIRGIVVKSEMVALYNTRMAKKRSPGRRYYDELIAAAPHGRCPLCGHREVSTLDHHLPKALFSRLAVAPMNLVPACADCNKEKRTGRPITATDETLHPYVDDIERDQWLRATVVEGPVATMKFYVLPPEAWHETLAKRVKNHFMALNLGRLNAAQAADELRNIQSQMVSIFSSAGMNAVKAHLEERAASCSNARLNSWQTATYDALAENAWYCGGGMCLDP